MYYYPQPPFLIPIIGLAIAMIFGATFQVQIEQKLRSWSKKPQDSSSYQLAGSGLALTYAGICLGVWIFLAGGFLTFGFGIIVAYGITLPITLFTASLIWSQLQEVFLQFKKGGFKAIDLDSFG
ncbi:MAG: hypothetical protein ACFCU5_12165 [Pleurocapsa sp.]